MNKHSNGPSAARAALRRTRDGAMLYDVSRAGNAYEEWFRSEFWLRRGAAARPRKGRGDALFIQQEDKDWVLRHYRRGGFIAHFSRDRYLWTGEEHTRPFLEWRLLFDLHRQGLPVPAPIAARYCRSGLFYRGELITERIAGAQPLSTRLETAALLPHVWDSVGRCVRRFHDAGVCHADLNAHNILIVEPAQIFLIDFDRGSIHRQSGPQSSGQAPWQASNLARLHRSLVKVTCKLPAGRFSDEDWKAVLRGYA